MTVIAKPPRRRTTKGRFFFPGGRSGTSAAALTRSTCWVISGLSPALVKSPVTYKSACRRACSWTSRSTAAKLAGSVVRRSSHSGSRSANTRPVWSATSAGEEALRPCGRPRFCFGLSRPMGGSSQSRCTSIPRPPPRATSIPVAPPRSHRHMLADYAHSVAPFWDQAQEILLVTDLLDNQQYPASDLLAVYLTRWGIERVFQQITEVFELRHLIGCTPEATIFQAAFCLVIYNLLQVIRAYVAASQVEMPVDAVSVEQIFVDVQKELTALTVLFPSPTIADWFATEMSREEIIAHLQILLGGVWTPRYRKAVNKKPRPKVKKAKGSGAHTSVHKVLEAEKKATKIRRWRVSQTCAKQW